MSSDEALERLRRLGFGETDARTLFEHFDDAERRGKRTHGYSRIEWLETLPDLRPDARPERVSAEEGYERWDSRGALGYLTLAAVWDAPPPPPPPPPRGVVPSPR